MATKKPAKKSPEQFQPIPAWDRGTAEEIFAARYALQGFDLDVFDQWLSTLVDCGAKTELIERRELALAAFCKDPNNKDATVRHLDWILVRWREIRREQFLLPLARAGKVVDEARRKPKRPELQEWIDKQVAACAGETIKDLWRRAPDWVSDEIGFDRFTKRVAAARKKAGIGRK